MRPESPTASAFWLQVEVLNVQAGPGTNQLVRLRDVTSHKAMQRDMWQFHAMVSHKLRTPMMGMMNGLELLGERIGVLSKTEIAEVSRITLQTTKRFHEAVEDILEYLNAPTLARHGIGFKLSQFQPMAAEIALALKLKAIEVLVPPELRDLQLQFSPHGIEIVLQEVLENAKKFHPRKAPHVEIVVSLESPDKIAIKISDDGMSLSPEQLAHICTPYYQAEKYLTGEVNGMGLGLSMVASLLWEVNGNCSVYNREGGPGLVVELVLPLAANEGKTT
jgi:signal transduction histidine kinase